VAPLGTFLRRKVRKNEAAASNFDIPVDKAQSRYLIIYKNRGAVFFTAPSVCRKSCFQELKQVTLRQSRHFVP